MQARALPSPPEAAFPVCPRCGEAHSIEKVSSIYASEISRRYYDLRHRYTQTELARLLKPPDKPGPTDLKGVSLLNLGVMLCGLSVYSGTCLFGGEPLRIPPSELVLVGVAVGTKGAGIYLSLIATATLLVGVPLGVGVALIRVGSKRIRSWRERLPLEKGRYDQAIHRWERLYYCARDDGLFIDGDVRLVPVTRVWELLYADQAPLNEQQP
jgi:hypothetical protein